VYKLNSDISTRINNLKSVLTDSYNIINTNGITQYEYTSSNSYKGVMKALATNLLRDIQALNVGELIEPVLFYIGTVHFKPRSRTLLAKIILVLIYILIAHTVIQIMYIHIP